MRSCPALVVDDSPDSVRLRRIRARVENGGSHDHQARRAYGRPRNTNYAMRRLGVGERIVRATCLRDVEDEDVVRDDFAERRPWVGVDAGRARPTDVSAWNGLAVNVETLRAGQAKRHRVAEVAGPVARTGQAGAFVRHILAKPETLPENEVADGTSRTPLADEIDDGDRMGGAGGATLMNEGEVATESEHEGGSCGGRIVRVLHRSGEGRKLRIRSEGFDGEGGSCSGRSGHVHHRSGAWRKHRVRTGLDEFDLCDGTGFDRSHPKLGLKLGLSASAALHGEDITDDVTTPTSHDRMRHDRGDGENEREGGALGARFVLDHN